MKPAFSTVACPRWTFPRLFDHLERWGFIGCELRTFGYGSAQFACDPALTDAAKVRLGFEKAGVSICSLGTGLRYDEKFSPPVLASVFHEVDRSVRETKSLVDLALQLECPLVRVFAFELPSGEERKAGLARVVDRLKKAADHCRNSGVRLMLENGGSFCRAVDLAEILDQVDNPMLEACYSAPVAQAVGEDPSAGLNVLGDRCVCVKIKDLKGGQPCVLGEGDLRCRETVSALSRAGYDGWVVYEFDRAWLAGDEWDVDAVMSQSARTLYEWAGGRAVARV
ncbi:MAG: sugar phosphate isomerase/epimerase family protein [Phycisphaerales bacterium]